MRRQRYGILASTAGIMRVQRCIPPPALMKHDGPALLLLATELLATGGAPC